MLVSYSLGEVPAVKGPDVALAHFKRMTEDGLPAFVIREAGDSLDEVLSEYNGVLAVAGFTAGVKLQLGFNKVYPKNIPLLDELIDRSKLDQKVIEAVEDSFHIDSASDLDGPDLAAINLHFTSFGGVEANLFDIKDEYLVRCLFDTEFPLETFSQEQVDEMFEPINYRTHTWARDMLVFRAEGRKPLAHCFRSLTPRRDSSVAVANFNGSQQG